MSVSQRGTDLLENVVLQSTTDGQTLHRRTVVDGGPFGEFLAELPKRQRTSSCLTDDSLGHSGGHRAFGRVGQQIDGRRIRKAADFQRRYSGQGWRQVKVGPETEEDDEALGPNSASDERQGLQP